MWVDGQRQPNTLYVAAVSRGKDSTAMLEAIRLMGWPLDMIFSVDVWFDDDTPAELPPMVAFKEKWDKKCLERFGLPVTRLCATKKGPQSIQVERQSAESDECITRNNLTYKDEFYKKLNRGRNCEIYGFPHVMGGWCKKLKNEKVYLKQDFLTAQRTRRRK